ncbi:ankyrin repeat domain-containing protein [Sphingobacterium sp.]|uniref:ankyrin repeat domain-containing protein n=1 Tax=Sphingobacterium sp. TaxID=341027 RepID=UPI003916F1F1
MVKLLLDNSAAIDKQDASGNTALHYAASYGKKDIVRYLLTNGATTDIANVLEQKPIDYSNIKGYNEITALLIDFGAKTNAIEDGEVKEKTNTPPPAQTLDMAEKKKALFDLKELLDAKIITEEEFQEQKKKILG